MPGCRRRLHRAFRARRPQAGFDNALSRDFPNITNVDVSDLDRAGAGVLDQVIRAVEFLFGFTLAAGLVVLFAAVTATREGARSEFAVMRAMGAGAPARAGAARRAARRRRAGRVLASLAAVAVGWGWRATPSSSAGTRRPGAAGRPAALTGAGRAGGLRSWPPGGGGLRAVLRRPESSAGGGERGAAPRRPRCGTERAGRQGCQPEPGERLLAVEAAGACWAPQALGGGGRLFHQRGVLLRHLVELRDRHAVDLGRCRRSARWRRC